MGIVKRDCCKCDVCGYEWLPKKTPRQCSQCKSRAWNGGAVVPEVPIKPAKLEPYSVKTASGKMSDAEYKDLQRNKVKLKS